MKSGVIFGTVFRMKKTPIRRTPLAIHLYLKENEYEYLRRRAVHEGHNSIQLIIKARIFKPNWKSELRELQEEQKKLGFKDTNFYHPHALKKMGVKVQRGRKSTWTDLLAKD